MDICIDVQSAVSQRAGVGRYTRLLAQHLAETAGDDSLNLFCFDFRRKGRPFPAARAAWRMVRWCPGAAAQLAWKTLNWPPFERFAGRADLYHFPNFVLPPLTAGRAVVTIHDITFARLPALVEERNLRYLNARLRDTVARADAILTVSQFSADEIRDAFNVPQERVFPIYNGISEAFRPPSADAVTALRLRLNLDRPYLLTVGTVEPRKNIPFMIEVFERLRGFDGCLVLAGMKGWKCEPILERMRTSTRSADIRWIRYVDDADLPALYAGADAFLCTSVYEGFGFPPLEAMACGTPVVSSRGGSLPEVLGSAAVLVPVFEPDLWSAEVERVLSDGEQRSRLRAAGRKQAAGYTWAAAARQTWQVYRKVAG